MRADEEWTFLVAHSHWFGRWGRTAGVRGGTHRSLVAPDPALTHAPLPCGPLGVTLHVGRGYGVCWSSQGIFVKWQSCHLETLGNGPLRPKFRHIGQTPASYLLEQVLLGGVDEAEVRDEITPSPPPPPASLHPFPRVWHALLFLLQSRGHYVQAWGSTYFVSPVKSRILYFDL